jgi:tetratricopeptide (TPR) repeat protein/transcriptional regulator with XRE-family HTH domain
MQRQMQTFSELLSEYIQRIGVSDAELARRLGVSRQTIFRWREGHIQRPRYREDVLDLARKLRLSDEERDQFLLAAGFPPEKEREIDGEPARLGEGGSGQNLLSSAGRYWVLGVIALVVLAIWLLVYPDAGPKPAAEGEQLILVSEFIRAGGELGFNVADRLEEGIQDAVEDLALETFRVETCAESIQDEMLALGLLEELNATLIVWGEYDSGRVVAQFLSRDLKGQAQPREQQWMLDTSLNLPATINIELPQEVNWLALFAIGRSLQVQGAYDQAQQAYESALHYVSENQAGEALLYFYLGYVEGLKSQGDVDRVIAYYSEALSRQAQFPSALNNRAVAYMTREAGGDLERAREDLLTALQAAPQDATLYLNLGIVRIWLENDLEQAIEDFKQGASLESDSASIQNALCWNLSLAHQPEKALPYCDQAIALDPSASHYDSRGLTLALLGRDAEAIEAFHTSLDLFEETDPAHYVVISPSRLAWIVALEAGENPFDEGTLKSLLHE